MRTYCDLIERIETLREQVGRNGGEGTLVEKLRDAQQQRAALEQVVVDPNAALRTREQPDAVAEEIEAALDHTIQSITSG